MAKKKPPAPRASEVTVSDTVIVRVGPQSKKYTLHKRLLIYYAEYFRGALSGHFRETEDGVVTLGDVQTDEFDVFVDRIYEKRLSECVAHPAQSRSNDTVTLLFRTYALADRSIAPDLKSTIFDAFFGKYSSGTIPWYTFFSLSFSSLPAQDPLLQLLIDAFWINNGHISPFTEANRQVLIRCLEAVPQGAFVRIMLRMHELQGLGSGGMKLRREAYNI